MSQHALPSLLRTVSTEHLDICHPTPDVHSLQAFLAKNVERIEQSAEELSQGGSDIGEEIRKMQEEQRRSESRRASNASHRSTLSTSSIPPVVTTQRSRNPSTSSYTNSIIEVNKEARWGGYSPAAFVTSPTASVRSGSWSHIGLNRAVSNTSVSRPEPVQEGKPLDSPLASPPSIMSVFRQPSSSSLVQKEAPLEHTEHMEDQDYFGEEGEGGESHDNGHEDHVIQEQNQIPWGAEDHVIQEQDQIPWGAEDHGEQDDGYRPPTPPDRPGSSDTYRQANILFRDFDGVHFSPTHEDGPGFGDEGAEDPGMSAEEIEQEEERRRLHQQQQQQQQQRRSTSRLSMGRPLSYAGIPNSGTPPPEGMVYYPAPVPRMLNLPKRLSQLPAAHVQAQRRSQVLNVLPQNTRQSAPWLPSLDFQDEEQRTEADPTHEEGQATDGPQQSPQRQNRQSRQSLLNHHRMTQDLSNLPPQLRASIFFDQPSVQHDVEIKSESAVATLDSILEASANAPVSAFTDHPFAGNNGAKIYAKEFHSKRHTMATPLIADARNIGGDDGTTGKTKHRNSIAGLLTRRQSGDLDKTVRRNSFASLLTDFGASSGGNKLRKRSSKMSLTSQMELAKVDSNDDNNTARRRSRSSRMSLAGDLDIRSGHEHDEAQHVDADEDVHGQYEGYEEDNTAHDDEGTGDEIDGEEMDEEEGDGEPTFVQPTTLLAELQLRKAQQQTRNRTAATAYPRGMHSTLLELDAVAQIEKKKRKTARVALAWEDPAVAKSYEHEAEDDEDVPLGVLYSGPTGQKASAVRRINPDGTDWDRPLGLIARRQIEDNEPLSRRRDRLMGHNPNSDASFKGSAHTQQRLRIEEGGTIAGSVAADGASVYQKEDEEEEEPLAQRLARLKRKATLDAALGDVGKIDSNSMFADDMMSQFGGLTKTEGEKGDDKAAVAALAPPPPPAVAPEDETLGQRRARLQRERGEQRNVSDPVSNASGEAQTRRQSSNSLADLLSKNPMGPTTMTARQAATAAGRSGTLLGENSRAQEHAKRRFQEHVLARSASSTLLPQGPVRPAGRLQAGLQQYNSFGPGPVLQHTASMPMGFPAATAPYMTGAAALSSQRLPSTPMATGYGVPGYGQQMMNPYLQQHYAGQQVVPGMMAPNPMYGMQYPPGVNMGMGMNTGMGMGMGMNTHYNMNAMMGMTASEIASMDPAQRDLIDRWRASIAQ